MLKRMELLGFNEGACRIFCENYLKFKRNENLLNKAIDDCSNMQAAQCNPCYFRQKRFRKGARSEIRILIKSFLFKQISNC